MQIDDSVLLDIHRRMVRIRVFETEAGKLAEAGKILAHSTFTLVRKPWRAGSWLIYPMKIGSRARTEDTVI